LGFLVHGAQILIGSVFWGLPGALSVCLLAAGIHLDNT